MDYPNECNSLTSLLLVPSWFHTEFIFMANWLWYGSFNYYLISPVSIGMFLSNFSPSHSSPHPHPHLMISNTKLLLAKRFRADDSNSVWRKFNVQWMFCQFEAFRKWIGHFLSLSLFLYSVLFELDVEFQVWFPATIHLRSLLLSLVSLSPRIISVWKLAELFVFVFALFLFCLVFLDEFECALHINVR